MHSKDNVEDFFNKLVFECECFDDYRRLLQSKIDAVMIVSPNAFHAEMCIDAARAGKHIFCEKPMAITLDDCKRIREAVEKARVRYLIGHHRWLNPLYQYAKQLLDSGQLGRAFRTNSDKFGTVNLFSWADMAESGVQPATDRVLVTGIMMHRSNSCQ